MGASVQELSGFKGGKEMAEKTTWEIITDRQTALSELYKRMDETSKYLYWDDNPYRFVKPDGKTELDDGISITPNTPKVFAHSVISNLLTGKFQTVVDGKLSPKETHTIEQFIEDNFLQADEYIRQRFRISSLFSWLCNHVCNRGLIGVKWLAQIENGQYKISCVPLDMRFCPFEDGSEGIRDGWIAHITRRSPKALKAEYPEASISGTRDLEVRDYWDAEKNEVWAASEKIFEQKNGYGYPPFVVQIPSAGFQFRDEGYLKHEGEDALFLNKGLFMELARTLSLEQTAGYASIYPGYEKQKEFLDGKPSEKAPRIDESRDVLRGETHIPVPRGDMSRAGISARADILKMIGEGGTITPRSYNTPPSAVELFGEAELISQFQNCRKEAIGALRSELSMMMIDQFIKVSKGKSGVEIGSRGKKNIYSAGQLGDPEKYYVTYHLMVKSKRQELANLTEFAAVYNLLPLEYNLKNILMAEDPDGIIRQLELEKAKKMNPALALAEMGLRYLEEAENTEDEIMADLKREQAQIIAHEYVMLMRAKLQPPPAQPIPTEVGKIKEEKANIQPLVPLLGSRGLMGGGGGSPRQVGAEVEERE